MASFSEPWIVRPFPCPLTCTDSLKGIVAWLRNLLTRQKKDDFRPRDDELSFARTNTDPCEMCCDFLGTVRDTVKEGLSGKNAEAFLTEVGVAFHRSVSLINVDRPADNAQLAARTLQKVPGEPDRGPYAHQVRDPPF